MRQQRSILPALRWRQEHLEIQASLGYTARLCLKTKQSWDLNNGHGHGGHTCCCLFSLPVSHLACLRYSKLAPSIVRVCSPAADSSFHLQERTWDQAVRESASATIRMKRWSRPRSVLPHVFGAGGRGPSNPLAHGGKGRQATVSLPGPWGRLCVSTCVISFNPHSASKSRYTYRLWQMQKQADCQRLSNRPRVTGVGLRISKLVCLCMPLPLLRSSIWCWERHCWI